MRTSQSGRTEGDEDSYEEMAEINIIPLVDIMLVLLIIFMVAAPLSMTGIPIQLPETRGGQPQIEEKRIVLTITEKGEYYFDRLKVAGAELETHMFQVFEPREQKDLYIRADRRVIYEKVIHAMGSARQAGVTKIGMLTSLQDLHEDI